MKYTFLDLLRNRWTILYFALYLLVTTCLLLLSKDEQQVIITLSNINLALIPLICLFLGSLYFYTSKEYIHILLAQPISRWRVFFGLYLGLSISLFLAPIVGMLLPFLFLQGISSQAFPVFLIMLSICLVLTCIFLALSFVISLLNDNRLKGLAWCLFVWLFFVLIYDAIFLLIIVAFRDYPLEKLTVFLSILNPVDMSRILILLQLDTSAMMGFTGAVLKKFLGSHLGQLLIIASLSLWLLIPMTAIYRIAKNKDF